jgi:hypothetical protein
MFFFGHLYFSFLSVELSYRKNSLSQVRTGLALSETGPVVFPGLPGKIR